MSRRNRRTQKKCDWDRDGIDWWPLLEAGQQLLGAGRPLPREGWPAANMTGVFTNT